MNSPASVTAQNPVAEWKQWPLRFQLYSSNAEVAERAGAILSYWNFAPRPGDKFLKTVSMFAEQHPKGFLLTVNESESTVYADIWTLMRALEMHAALALLEEYEHVTSVHAGLLSRNSHGVIIVGPSQSGKSTLSCALWHAGWQLLADDVALLDCETCEASPLLRRVSLRDPSRELLGGDFWEKMLAAKSCDRTPEGYVFHPDELTLQSRARSSPVSAIVFLARNGAPQLPPAQSNRIDPAHAILALAPYTNCLQHTDLGATMRRLGPLLDAVPAYDLARGPLEEMIATVQQLAGC